MTDFDLAAISRCAGTTSATATASSTTAAFAIPTTTITFAITVPFQLAFFVVADQLVEQAGLQADLLY